MKWLVLILLSGCVPLPPPRQGDDVPTVDHCADWCVGLRTCEGATDDFCEDDCREMIEDPTQLRVSGLTRDGMTCVAKADGCKAVEACEP